MTEFGVADVVETGVTFEANAALKALTVARETGLPALADDSGLAVDALNGMPGVRSARWAGAGASDADNNALLLRQLDDVPGHARTAHFACAVALVLPDGTEHTTVGRMTGVLLRQPVGENGFGYDPLFVADGQSVSNGELEPAAKDAISHRGTAVRAMVPLLIAELERLAGDSAGQEEER